MLQNNGNNHDVVFTEIKKEEVGWSPLRIFGLSLGIVSSILALIPLFIFSIGGPIGIFIWAILVSPAFIGAFVGFMTARKTQQISCPVCDKRYPAWQDRDSSKCPRCKKDFVIRWKEQ